MDPKPGDGIKSLRTSNAFRILNFELYTKPNKIIMGFGLVSIVGCIGYIFYMRHKYESMGYYRAVTEEGEVYARKKSNWER